MLRSYTAASTKRSFASLSAVRSRRSTGLVYTQIDTQIDEPWPRTGAWWSNEVNDCNLDSAPVWRSRASVAADAINSAAAEALLDAHNVALQNQAEMLRAEASAEMAAAMQKQQEMLTAVQQENRLLQQDIAAQQQELQQQANKSNAVDDTPAAAVGEEIEQLRNQLASVRRTLRLAVLDKSFTATPAAELLSLPASALQGVGGKTATALEAVGIATLGDLATWKVIGAARAACAQDSSAAAVGLASCTGEVQALQALRLKTAEDVAEWKFALFAETMAMEATDRQED